MLQQQLKKIVIIQKNKKKIVNSKYEIVNKNYIIDSYQIKINIFI